MKKKTDRQTQREIDDRFLSTHIFYTAFKEYLKNNKTN